MKKRHITHGLCVLSVILSAALASPARAATVDVSVEGTVTKPTCSVTTSEKKVSFGAVAPGENKSHSSLSVAVQCAGTVATHVWAYPNNKLTTGSFQNVLYLLIDGVLPPDGERTVFQMTDEDTGKLINFMPLGNGFAPFCHGTATRTCLLTSRVSAQKNAKKGSGAITIVFNLSHT